MRHKEIKERALQFLMMQKGGVISTVSGDQPQGAFVYYDADEDFSVYFPTPASTRKHQNIKANSKVAFTVTSMEPAQTIQMDGIIEEVSDEALAKNSLGNYIGTAADGTRDAPPLTKLDLKEGVALYRIRPTWLKWSDFSDEGVARQGSPSVVLIGEGSEEAVS